LDRVKDFSLYIHVPFCRSFCDYCDFYSVLLPEESGPLIDAYINTLLADAEDLLARLNGIRVPTVYIGGGSPSVLGVRGIRRLLGGLKALLPHDSREFTLEANPESADEDFLLACREGGVNRLSLGVQTFHAPSRTLVKRRGDLMLLSRRLDLAATLFPGAFSLDLIAGLPGQSREILLADIERFLAYKPAHGSLYALTLEGETPLGKAVLAAGRRGENSTALPSPDEADAAWIAGRDSLERAGYRQYEVSNFCLPGKESRHNLRYWRMENWLGLGPAASGTLIDDRTGTGFRLSWPPDLTAWLARNGLARDRDWPPIEALDRLTLMKESLMMGFRCTLGPDPSLFFRRFGLDICEAIPRTLAKWREQGRLAEAPETAEPGGIALNREGLLYLDPFLLDAFGELS
jgi:oxygen-independent coproporphyrinogen-3 oxidase